MKSLLLNSVLIATVVIAVRTGSDPNPRRGLQRAVVGMCLFNAFYAFALLFIYPRL